MLNSKPVGFYRRGCQAKTLFLFRKEGMWADKSLLQDGKSRVQGGKTGKKEPVEKCRGLVLLLEVS